MLYTLLRFKAIKLYATNDTMNATIHKYINVSLILLIINKYNIYLIVCYIN